MGMRGPPGGARGGAAGPSGPRAGAGLRGRGRGPRAGSAGPGGPRGPGPPGGDGGGGRGPRRGERFAELKAREGGRPRDEDRGADAPLPPLHPTTEAPGGGGRPWEPDRVRQMVETSMLSALGGLMYLLGTTLRLEGYAAYFLPLPMILMAQRHCSGAAWRTLLTTATLLGVLFGPLKAMNYVLVHGVFGVAMAVGFRRDLPWAASVPLSALARGLGILGSLALSSFLINENLFNLLVYNVEALLANATSALGLGGGTPSPFAIQSAILGLVVFHCNVYAFLLHFLYSGVLPRMGLKCGRIPRLVARVAR